MNRISAQSFRIAGAVCLALLIYGTSQGTETPPNITVEISIAGNGPGIVVSNPPGIECGGKMNDCSGAFPENTPVTLQPQELSPESNFGGWSLLSGSAVHCGTTFDECTFLLLEKTSAQAEFIANSETEETSSGS